MNPDRWQKIKQESAAEFWTHYLRGQAFFKLNKGLEAAAEFNQIWSIVVKPRCRFCIRLRNSAWRALPNRQATLSRRSKLIRISLQSGKTPMLIYRFCNRQERSVASQSELFEFWEAGK